MQNVIAIIRDPGQDRICAIFVHDEPAERLIDELLEAEGDEWLTGEGCRYRPAVLCRKCAKSLAEEIEDSGFVADLRDTEPNKPEECSLH